MKRNGYELLIFYITDISLLRFTDGLQFFLLPLVLGTSLLSLGAANTLFAVAFGWYFYITHLGYRGERDICNKKRAFISKFNSLNHLMSQYISIPYNHRSAAISIKYRSLSIPNSGCCSNLYVQLCGVSFWIGFQCI